MGVVRKAWRKVPRICGKTVHFPLGRLKQGGFIIVMVVCVAVGLWKVDVKFDDLAGSVTGVIGLTVLCTGYAVTCRSSCVAVVFKGQVFGCRMAGGLSNCGCSRCTVGISLVFSVGVLFRDVQGVYQFFILFIGFFNQRFTERDGGYLLSGSLALCSEALDTDKLICVDENRFLWLGSGGYEFYLD